MNEADANVSWNPWDSDRIPSFGSIRSLVQTVLACLKSADVQLKSENLIEDDILRLVSVHKSFTESNIQEQNSAASTLLCSVRIQGVTFHLLQGLGGRGSSGAGTVCTGTALPPWRGAHLSGRRRHAAAPLQQMRCPVPADGRLSVCEVNLSPFSAFYVLGQGLRSLRGSSESIPGVSSSVHSGISHQQRANSPTGVSPCNHLWSAGGGVGL